MKTTLGILFFSLICSTTFADSEKKGYPENFEWGAALSAHQTEGVAGGGENSDWYRLEHPKHGVKPIIAHGDTADIATDFWNRYPEDLELAKKMGLTMLRTSVSWEKIEPEPGKFNQEVIEHYREIFKKMNELFWRYSVSKKPLITGEYNSQVQ